MAAIYVDPRYHVLLQSQITLAQVHLVALWKRLQMLRGLVDDTPDIEFLDSSSESESGSTPTRGIDIIEEILVTSNAHNAKSSTLPPNERNVRQMVQRFNNQARLPRSTNVFEWWDKQSDSELKQVANVAIALLVTQASFERTFSGLRYILDVLRLGLLLLLKGSGASESATIR